MRQWQLQGAKARFSEVVRLVTRNARDFVGVGGLEVVNPWKLYPASRRA